MEAVEKCNAEFDTILKFVQGRNWDGLRTFVENHRDYACKMGSPIAGLLYSFVWGVKNPKFVNLSTDQLKVLFSLHRSGAKLNRNYTLVSYVARFDPDKEDGGYIVDFPDLGRVGFIAVDQRNNLREAEIRAKKMLAEYVASRLEEHLGGNLVEPKYRIRNGLKTIKQRRVSVNLDDLVRAEAAS